MESPFHVGNHLRLGAFNRQEADSLIRRGLPALSVRDADSLFELLGGQPFLLQAALYWLAEGRTVDDLAQVATNFDGPFGAYLEFLGHSLSDEGRRALLLAQSELSTLTNAQRTLLEEVGILRETRTGHEWASALHKEAFGSPTRHVV